MQGLERSKTAGFGIGPIMTHVLIIEDNAHRMLIVGLLNSHFRFMSFEEGGNGEEAFQKIKKSLPHIIFLDTTLPGENGLEIIKKIRSAYPGVIIISMGSYDLPEYRQAAKQHGADFFWSKGSSSSQEMLALVESILSKPGSKTVKEG